jgi:glutathione synthase/RimK-type ligase-like ATP-grasp enzyme
LRFLFWFWTQNPPRAGFNAEKVNRAVAMLRENLTLPHSIACVTDEPEGIDPSVDILPMREIVPDFLRNMQAPGWNEKNKLPQCYRRLPLWHRDAARMFGGTRLVSMDIDFVALANLDSVFDHDADVKLLQGTSRSRPYNGGLVQITAGARPQVFENITQEGINESRKKFVGSDQAWISHVLGCDEAKFNHMDGVYNWTPKFVNMNSGGRQFLFPGDARLIFFPANPKPWDMRNSHPRIYATWAGEAQDRTKVFQPQPRLALRRRLWAYDDPKGWGKAFQAEAKAAGHRSWLFQSSQNVADGEVAFVRLDQQGAQRDVSKGVLARLAQRGIRTLPTVQEGIWYDDKLAQYTALAQWLPETWIENTRAGAESRLEALSIEGAFPIISKAAEGAGSANVRMLNNEDEAWAESVAVFGSGLPLKYGRIQKGYVYWQRLVSGNDCDYRICIVGDYAYGLVRENRPGTVFASGSGKFRQLTLADDRERAAMALAREISAAIGTRWMAYDFVFDDATPKVLEMSSAWTMSAYKECRMFNKSGAPVKLTGSDSFKVAVAEMLALSESCREAAA